MKFFQHFDQYAQNLEVNLAGKARKQSSFGGIVSLITYIIVLIEAGYLAKKLVLREDPQITTFEIIKDLASLGEVSAKDLNFDLAIIYWSEKLKQPIPLDPTYFSVRFSLYKATNYTTTERTPLQNPLIPCNSDHS